MNLMPISICKKLKLLNLRLTTMVIKLANSSIRRLAGILEEFPIQVGKFVIPCDFIVLDMDENSQAPVILGRSSLATAGAVIECRHTHYLFTCVGRGWISVSLHPHHLKSPLSSHPLLSPCIPSILLLVLQSWFSMEMEAHPTPPDPP